MPNDCVVMRSYNRRGRNVVSLSIQTEEELGNNLKDDKYTRESGSRASRTPLLVQSCCLFQHPCLQEQWR